MAKDRSSWVHRFFCACAALLVVATSAAELGAQSPTWQQRVASAPPGRNNSAAAYDVYRGVTTVFGGYNGTTTAEMILLFSNFPAGGFGGSSVGIADINGFGRPRDAAVLMGVLGRGLDTSMAGMPPLPRDGCIYAIAPRSLPAGLTTTWTTLTAWEPATGEGLGATMAH